MIRLIVLGVLAALVAASTAEAKFRMTLSMSDRAPAPLQPIRVALRAEVPVADAPGLRMRLLAVPPGMYVEQALSDEARYAIRLVRQGRVWRGLVRFPRRGRWRLVVPNWGAPGYASPPPLVRDVDVRKP